MAKEKFYRQCSLSNGTGRTHGYIEERGAIVGKRVELIEDDRNLWTVDSVGDKRVPYSLLKFAESANKHASIA